MVRLTGANREEPGYQDVARAASTGLMLELQATVQSMSDDKNTSMRDILSKGFGILMIQPLHIAAEQGHEEIVKVTPTNYGLGVMLYA
jgi:hypothetical protein